jgi:hypothetical protein
MSKKFKNLSLDFKKKLNNPNVINEQALERARQEAKRRALESAQALERARQKEKTRLLSNPSKSKFLIKELKKINVINKRPFIKYSAYLKPVDASRLEHLVRRRERGINLSPQARAELRELEAKLVQAIKDRKARQQGKP